MFGPSGAEVVNISGLSELLDALIPLLEAIFYVFLHYSKPLSRIDCSESWSQRYQIVQNKKEKTRIALEEQNNKTNSSSRSFLFLSV